jgi:hypothetical protein
MARQTPQPERGMTMFSMMALEARYKLGEIGPWSFYKVEEGSYVFIVDTTAPEVELSEGSDNFIIVTANSFSDAIDTFTQAME